ncbi:HEAT repeat domain-containing protein [Myxococcaceae bacterium GXIMD 01537]
MSKTTTLLPLGAALVLGGAAFFYVRGSAEPDWTKPDAVASLAEDRLLEALKAAPDATSKRGIVQRLGRRPDPLGTMKQVWSAHADEDVRDEVILVTERLGTPDAARWLAQLAEDETMGGRAGTALGRMGSAAAAPVLAEVAASNASPLPRANAVLALADSGSKEHAGLLAALVADKGQPQRVRQEAAMALARLGGPEQVGPLASVLEETAADRSQDAEQLRISIIQGLGGIKAPEARAALEKHLARELSEAERAFLSQALAP